MATLCATAPSTTLAAWPFPGLDGCPLIQSTCSIQLPLRHDHRGIRPVPIVTGRLVFHRRFGVKGTVRASLAPYDTREDIDTLVEALLAMQVRPRSR